MLELLHHEQASIARSHASAGWDADGKGWRRTCDLCAATIFNMYVRREGGVEACVDCAREEEHEVFQPPLTPTPTPPLPCTRPPPPSASPHPPFPEYPPLITPPPQPLPQACP